MCLYINISTMSQVSKLWTNCIQAYGELDLNGVFWSPVQDLLSQNLGKWHLRNAYFDHLPRSLICTLKCENHLQKEQLSNNFFILLDSISLLQLIFLYVLWKMHSLQFRSHFLGSVQGIILYQNCIYAANEKPDIYYIVLVF